MLPFETEVKYYPHSLFAPFGAGPTVPTDRIPRLRILLLGHFGADDKNPSPTDRERLDRELTTSGFAHQFYSYEGAGHGFAVNNEARSNFRETQAIAANNRTVEWLERELRGASVVG